MANFAFFDQLEQKINFLISERKLKEAFNLCKDTILKYPSETRFNKIKTKIEEAVEEENQSIIQDKLEKVKILWKDGKYLDILKILKELILAAPNNTKIKNLYTEAEEAYRKQYQELRARFIKEQELRLTEVLNNNQGQLLEELFILEKENEGNSDVKKLVNEFQDKLIERKIKDKSDLLLSDKYDVIDNFLKELRKIDKSNPRIQDIIQAVKKRKLEGEVVQKQEYLYSGEKHLDTLLKLGKYDKVIKAAEEILFVDKNNVTVQNILATAKQKYSHQLKYLTAESIENNYQTLKQEYISDKSNFIKL